MFDYLTVSSNIISVLVTQLFVLFCEAGTSSHLMIVQGPNLTENYQSTNQDKTDKILSYVLRRLR